LGEIDPEWTRPNYPVNDRTLATLHKRAGFCLHASRKTREETSRSDRNGCVVRAALDAHRDDAKLQVSNAELAIVRLKRPTFHDEWNDAVSP
jgi:hypothetical protein